MSEREQKIAVVTGASSGIGAATARALATDGWYVIAAARRYERVAALAEEIGGQACRLDVTDEESVLGLARCVAERGGCDLLVNNAGGARGLDPVIEADIEKWRWMYEVNVLGTLRVSNALHEALAASPHGGLVVNIGSVAGLNPYPGGAGYNAAKFGLRALTRVQRIEEASATPEGLRVTQIDPGRVHTEEFSLNRFDGDAARAAAVYEGVLSLSAEDIAEAVRWVASLPAHVNVDHLHLMPKDQA
ncbi:MULTISPECIES: SDR family oxidoreductase [unclassified Corynebacterium]|uniref:SDR family oxidoreductase n=1 Tax=unclassified Corynebacterium TaxID=2624378 RepID=UPI0029C9C352|nr:MULTISPECIES: SDR family oxidoreductase [unclassified Corynebacterium]WPF66222.1 SDR family oxidoreductase [Corynebacterium sp. 22KM0430]WPF68712.1 SDR family oxidoreductase [Corynebacterium sp. 21KM1197]